MFYIFEAMSFKFTLAYFIHQLTAKNRHGTHSPFVYRLADEVIYDFSDKKVYEAIETQRKKLLNDDSNVVVTDLQENNILLKKDVQKVKMLAKSLLKTPRLAQLLFRLGLNSRARHILVFDANFGINTAYLAKACPQAKVIAVENCAAIAAISKKRFEELELNHVELLVGNFNELLPRTESLDLIYIDGSPTKTSFLNYFNWCLPQLHEHSLLIANDIHKTEEMKEAWDELKNHPQVTVTIDLFWLGLVYFKKGQAKEHFKLKF